MLLGADNRRYLPEPRIAIGEVEPSDTLMTHPRDQPYGGLVDGIIPFLVELLGSRP